MADLRWVHKAWFGDDTIKARLEERGIGHLVVTAKNNPLAVQDVQHALWNLEVLVPIMHSMKQHHLIKTPHKATIERQVLALYLMWEGQTFDIDKLPPIPEEDEIPIHLVVTSIKRLVSFVRSKFLRPHTPRDPEFRELLTAFGDLELFLDLPDPDSKSKSPDDSDAENEDEDTHDDFVNLSLVKRQDALNFAAGDADETQPLESLASAETLEYPVGVPGAEKEEVWVPPNLDDQNERQPQLEESPRDNSIPVVTRTSQLQLKGEKKDENAKGKGKNAGKNKGPKTQGKKNQRKSKHSTLRRLSSKLRESKQGQEEVMPSGSAEPPSAEHDLQQEAAPKRKRQNSKVSSKGKKALKAKADSVEEAETGHGTPETGRAKNVRKRKSTKEDKGKQVGKAKGATKTKKEKTTSPAKKNVGPKTKKRSKKTDKKKKTNQVEPAPEEADNKLPESDAAIDAARDAEEPPRKRFKHDENTKEIKNIVDNLNQQFDGNFKVMIYWSRSAVAFMVYDSSEEKLKQVQYCAVPPQNLLLAAKAMATIAGAISGGKAQEQALADFNVYRPILTNASRDPRLVRGLDRLIASYMEDAESL